MFGWLFQFSTAAIAPMEEPSFLLEETQVAFRQCREQEMGDAQSRREALASQAREKREQAVAHGRTAAHTAVQRELRRRQCQAMESRAAELRQMSRSQVWEGVQRCAYLADHFHKAECEKIAYTGTLISRKIAFAGRCPKTEHKLLCERRVVRWTEGRIFLAIITHKINRNWGTIRYDEQAVDCVKANDVIPERLIVPRWRQIIVTEDILQFTDGELEAVRKLQDETTNN